MSHGDAVARWTVSRCEPLISEAYREAADQGLQSLAAGHPHWFSAWSAGVLSELVATLDPEDPWRNTEDRDGTVTLPDGSPFGEWENATDLVPLPPGADPALDLGLAAVAEPLPPGAARLWLAAQSGREEAEALLQSINVGSPYPLAVPAIERAMFRRRIFMGQEDAYIPYLCVEWTNRAERIINAEPWDESGAARLREGSRVEPGTWRMLA